MDPQLVRDLMAEGRLHNLRRLADAGGFLDLQTSAPAQSPVAWSNFITGAGPATHRIFDFIHRRTDLVPYLSTSSIEPPSRNWAIPAGSWRIPLAAARPKLPRRGTPFWNHLGDADVPVTIYRVPANYPPVEVEGVRCLCGMGTPDLLGTYGLFTVFESGPTAQDRPVSGGRFVRLKLEGDRGVARLPGPDNFLKTPDDRGRRPPMTAAIALTRDPDRDVVRLEVGESVLLLNTGEWSEWTPVEFETGITGATALEVLQVPTSARGMVRFHLVSAHPEVKVYVSPINVDPRDPATPIASPDSFASEVADACGPYHTTGIPEDTKALRAGALDEDEFLAQVETLKGERLRQYRHALASFEAGFLFFYFGHVDQLSHVFWRDRDPDHPAHDRREAERFGTVVEDAYVEMDALVGEAMDRLEPDDTLIVMSDHGFASFRRGFHLNRWLQDNGYLAVHDPSRQEHYDYLTALDWSGTKAYALGLNGLYLNVIGREPRGTVEPGAERRNLLERISKGLLKVRDENGQRVIERVDIVDDLYPGADREVAPDLLIGYARGYRASWATAEGGVPTTLFEDNRDRWSGDHCIAHDLVPGILLANRGIQSPEADLRDLAPTILGCFGLPRPDEMTGRDLFRPPGSTDEVHTAGVP
jgi:predicted AlkP superfamily phosphohydrolase/phosphomutase